MKSKTMKITMLAFVMIGTIACKNTEKEVETEMQEAAVATEMAHEYKVDTANSEIRWEGSKPTGKHHGTIQLSEGSFSVNQGEIEAGKFVIDMNSIDDEDLEGEQKANLEAHLKGTAEGKEGDFFNVQKFPTATFELTGIDGNIVKGNLTIKDKTNAIEFSASVNVDGERLHLKSETIELDRTKWGVNYGSLSVFPSLGDQFISDTMKITVSLVASKV